MTTVADFLEFPGPHGHLADDKPMESPFLNRPFPEPHSLRPSSHRSFPLEIMIHEITVGSEPFTWASENRSQSPFGLIHACWITGAS